MTYTNLVHHPPAVINATTATGCVRCILHTTSLMHDDENHCMEDSASHIHFLHSVMSTGDKGY